MVFSVLVTSANGHVFRCGPDESDVGWIPTNITWGSQIPGGWKDASFDLLRRIDEEVPLRLLDDVEIVRDDGKTVYEGRIQQLPRQHGDNVLLSVKCLGHSAHLLDDPSFREIYMDRDMGRWQGPTLERQLAMLAAGYTPDGWSTESGRSPSEDAAVVHKSASIDQPGGVIFLGESWYDAQGIDIEFLVYAFQATGLGNGGDPNWITRGVLSTDAVGSTFDVGTDFNGANGPTLDTIHAADAGRKFALFQTGYAATYTGGPIVGGWNAYYRRPVIAGRHGLTITLLATGDGAYWADDILAHAIAKAAPKLNFSTGPEGSIQRPSLAVAQAAYLDPGTVENVVLDINKLFLWDWGVYDQRTFFFRPPDPGRLTWEARLDRGTHLSLEGDDAEHVYNGCLVKYQLPDGTSRVAGPPGSGFDVEDAQLGDLSDENVVTVHNIPRKWIELEIQFPILDLYAVTIGAAYLVQAGLPARSGDIGPLFELVHPSQGIRPASDVRAGDFVLLSDHPADVPRKIVQTSHGDDGYSVTLSVGNDINKIDAVLEGLGVVTKARFG